MKKFSPAAVFIAALVLLLYCNTAPDQKESTARDTPAFDLSAARKWVAADNAKFSEEIKRGDSMAVAAHYASDAQLLLGNSEPRTGKGIAEAWGAVIRMGVKEFKINTTDLIGNAALLAETGIFEVYGEGNKLLDKGKYVVIWKPDNGAWKIYRDIGNSSLPHVPGGEK